MNLNQEPNSDDPPFTPLDAMSKVTRENGRWVVYLNVPEWQPKGAETPVVNHWKRINEYSTEQEARVAATWYERSANRNRPPSQGF